MKPNPRTFIYAALFSVIIWILWPAFVSGMLSCWTERGQFGDLYGGINALFSGLALAAVATAVWMQSEQLRLQGQGMERQLTELALQRAQLELQKEELRLTRQELSKTAEANRKAAEALSKQHGTSLIAAEIQGRTAKISAFIALAENTGSGRQQQNALEHAQREREAIERLIEQLNQP